MSIPPNSPANFVRIAIVYIVKDTINSVSDTEGIFETGSRRNTRGAP